VIVGSGLLAKTFAHFRHTGDLLIFASGVSNSYTSNLRDFEREERLLQDCLRLNKKIIYFGTCSVYDPDMMQSPYVTHKLNMEALIVGSSSKFIIFRLPQIIGSAANKHTLLNFLYKSISEGEKFDLWINAERNIVDINTVNEVVTYIVHKNLFLNEVINLASPYNIKVSDLVSLLEVIVGRPANYITVDKGAKYIIDTSRINEIYKLLKISFSKKSLIYNLNKYYG
jgi:nucleoside-diphosphate-sugar epimerase